jgi:hypothetical protein
LNERHLKLTLKIMGHAFQPRQAAHESGPEDTGATPHSPPPNGSRHSIPAGHVIRSTAILGSLHHEYALEKTAA